MNLRLVERVSISKYYWSSLRFFSKNAVTTAAALPVIIVAPAVEYPLSIAT